MFVIVSDVSVYSLIERDTVRFGGLQDKEISARNIHERGSEHSHSMFCLILRIPCRQSVADRWLYARPVPSGSINNQPWPSPKESSRQCYSFASCHRQAPQYLQYPHQPIHRV